MDLTALLLSAFIVAHQIFVFHNGGAMNETYPSGPLDESFVRALTDAIGDGITVIDPSLRILYQNRILASVYGDRVGQHCFKAYRNLDEPCGDCLVVDVLKDGRPRNGIRDVRLATGDVLFIEFSSAPLRDAAGKITGAVEVARDVTSQMRLQEECRTLRREMVRRAQFENIITQSRKMKTIFRLIERVAATTSSVAIYGESGTGKELIARAIHANSDRRDKPFIGVNCGAIPENLLESELFGHVKGAFTGAIRDRIGLVETAEHGTLFLDEVGEISPAFQVKLLRFLQEGEARRVGDAKARKFDVRIISASNRNLEQAVKDGAFREDLFFRLSVIPIALPALRERREDIPMLVNHFLHQLCDEHSRNITGISPKALKLLLEYSWPGNIRELENAIEYAIHLTDEGRPMEVEQLPAKIARTQDTRGEADPPGAPDSVDAYTRKAILSLQADHTEAQIAGILGFSRKSLWERRKRLDLPRPGKTS
jgi:two-component system, NtrC family, response regulator HydG